LDDLEVVASTTAFEASIAFARREFDGEDEASESACTVIVLRSSKHKFSITIRPFSACAVNDENVCCSILARIIGAKEVIRASCLYTVLSKERSTKMPKQNKRKLL
jgi:hypothetical protein